MSAVWEELIQQDCTNSTYCNEAQSKGIEMSEQDEKMRADFEEWYATNAFDYVSNPVGSRECGLKWEAWQASRAQSDLAHQADREELASAKLLLEAQKREINKQNMRISELEGLTMFDSAIQELESRGRKIDLLEEQLSAMTKDRDEWKESCEVANLRFKAAEQRIRNSQEQEPMAFYEVRNSKGALMFRHDVHPKVKVFRHPIIPPSPEELQHDNKLLSEARSQAVPEDSARLDFVIKNGAFITQGFADADGKDLQLLAQNVDEEYVILHNADSFFKTVRDAIDAAMLAAAPKPEGIKK